MMLDVAAAITGRVPAAGLHLDEARHATLVLRLSPDVPAALLNGDALFPVLGLVLGRRAGSNVAVIDGLAPGQSEDRLKALGAAAASSGSVAMFHVVGSTAEAPTLDAALGAGRADMFVLSAIATHPSMRGRGFATALVEHLTAKVCHSLACPDLDSDAHTG